MHFGYLIDLARAFSFFSTFPQGGLFDIYFFLVKLNSTSLFFLQIFAEHFVHSSLKMPAYGEIYSIVTSNGRKSDFFLEMFLAMAAVYFDVYLWLCGERRTVTERCA